MLEPLFPCVEREWNNLITLVTDSLWSPAYHAQQQLHERRVSPQPAKHAWRQAAEHPLVLPEDCFVRGAENGAV